jgi:hypothetical protein
MSPDQTPPFRAGDLVEVRPAAEILATLDEDGALEHVPFMPEMLDYVGRRFRVAQRAEKICDLVGPGGSRRMRDTVFLENLRCSGAAHGGCQAECRFYWKEAWLRSVTSDAAADQTDDGALERLTAVTDASTRPHDWDRHSERFRCQATEAFRATEPLRSRDPGQYVREVRSGNVGVLRVLRVLARGLWWSIGRRTGLRPHLPVPVGPAAASAPDRLDLRPGEWVEVRSPEEIGPTLDEGGCNRGLLFTPEMLGSCGRRAQVHKRVEKIISERTGEMLHLKNDCIMLEGVVCTGERAPGMWFCHRDSYPFWREAWLKRIASPEPNESPTAEDQLGVGTMSPTSASRATSDA